MFRKFQAEGSSPEGDNDQVSPETEDQSADEYLSRLAKSVLSKEKHPGGLQPQKTHTPPPDLPSARSRNRPKQETRRQTPPPTPEPREAPKARETPQPPAPAEPRRPQRQHGEWVREVDFYDEGGNLIPGTILLFEDGTVGVFKESVPSKDYDIVYTLKETGRVTPQGIPLYNYDVDPIGRLTQGCFDQLVRTGRWERDMIIFHLLKYKDRVHVPRISEAEPRPSSGDSITHVPMNMLNASEAAHSQKESEDEPAFKRGRRLTIQFGDQKWEAIYWGKDELGHVVAHHTHGKWALMHLDLARFKDSITLHDTVDNEKMQEIARDFAE